MLPSKGECHFFTTYIFQKLFNRVLTGHPAHFPISWRGLVWITLYICNFFFNWTSLWPSPVLGFLKFGAFLILNSSIFSKGFFPVKQICSSNGPLRCAALCWLFGVLESFKVRSHRSGALGKCRKGIFKNKRQFWQKSVLLKGICLCLCDKHLKFCNLASFNGFFSRILNPTSYNNKTVAYRRAALAWRSLPHEKAAAQPLRALLGYVPQNIWITTSNAPPATVFRWNSTVSVEKRWLTGAFFPSFWSSLSIFRWPTTQFAFERLSAPCSDVRAPLRPTSGLVKSTRVNCIFLLFPSW